MRSTIGIVAPCSQVPRIELTLGVDALIAAGFLVNIHPQVRQSHWFFAGRDTVRAQGFLEFSYDPEIEIVWAARGGYGALRLLPMLEKWTKRYGKPPKKLLVGYSDCIALMEFVRRHWGWETLHGPMPALRKFSVIRAKEWSALMFCLDHYEKFGTLVPQKLNGYAPLLRFPLKWITPPPKKTIRGPLIGGNLAVWHALSQSRFVMIPKGSILFLEDIDESLARLDRMVTSLILQGGMENVSAVVLGDFLNCGDRSPLVLKSKITSKNRLQLITSPKPTDLGTLRAKVNEQRVLKELFIQFWDDCRIPIARGLPVGHGPGFMPLPLGGPAEISVSGVLET